MYVLTLRCFSYVRDDRDRGEALSAVTAARAHLHAISHAKNEAEVADLQTRLGGVMVNLSLEEEYKKNSDPKTVKDMLKQLEKKINDQVSSSYRFPVGFSGLVQR